MSAPMGLGAEVDRAARRAMVRGVDPTDPDGPGPIEGIDIVEVLANRSGAAGFVPGAPQQRTLLVHLLNGPVPVGLTSSAVRVLGGVRADPRVNPVNVEWAHPASAVAGAGATPATPGLVGVGPADRALVAAATDPAARERILVVRTSSSGDWSTYVLALLGPSGTGYPAGFDEPLCREPFTFTVDCPDPLDCRCEPHCAPAPATSPMLDYLARDYAGLRTRLLDRFAELVPDWSDTNPADPAVTMLELFAHLGDRLTLWQDAVAAEAYLPTARRRTSVRRHARLLDYHVHEGSAARTWLAFTVPPGPDVHLAARHPVASLPLGSRARTVTDALADGGCVFETIGPAHLTSARNSLALHAWGDVDACLGTGTTSAFVALPLGVDPELAAGDVVILAPVDEDEVTVSGDEVRRRAVRLVSDPVVRDDPLAPQATVLEITWGPADALDVPLPISRRRGDGGAGVAARALANVVLAEHAATLPGVAPVPAQVPPDGSFTPQVAAGAAWVDPEVDRSSASASTQVDPRRARAQVELDDGSRTWTAVADLLASGRMDAHMVAEPDESRSVRLRFGDGVTGRRPTAGSVFTSHTRVGGGTAGNVGPDVLTTVLSPAGGGPTGDLTVTNPLAAVGGVAPESMAAVRELAPHAYRTQLRAVTSADHAATAAATPGVQRAVARRRWAGSWHTQQVTLDLMADRAGDAALVQGVRSRLELRRLAGVDVALAPPVPVPLEIVVGVCVADGYLRSDVRAAVLQRMSAGARSDGQLGFFHPDNFTFGQPLHLSDLVAAVMAVPGVTWVDVDDDGPTGPLRFRRLGATAAGEVAAARIAAAAREVLRADSDPSNPENGRFDAVMRGGS